MLVVNVIVPHIEIQHFVTFVGQSYGIVAAMPYFMLFRAGAQRKAGTVYRQQDPDIRVLRRSLLQRYHSLGADLNTVGRCCVAGCALSSTRKEAEVRPPGIAYVRNPIPGNRCGTSSSLAGKSEGVRAKPAKWKPIQARPSPCML